MQWTLRQSGNRKAQRPKQTKVEKQPWYFYQHQESKKHQIFYIKWVKLSWHQFKCTHNSFWKLCTEPLSAATRFFFVCSTFLVTHCFGKSRNITSKHHPLWKSSVPRSEEAALWKGTWPLALQLRPGSEQRAKVVITERLIADRTFQQPVVNWMELRGRKHQMHRPDRCSADDSYFRVVRGMHAILLYSFFF